MDQPPSQAPQALLARMRACLVEGQPPAPRELYQALAQARGRVAALAEGLGLGDPEVDHSRLPEDQLKAYEAALLLGMDLTLLALELARQHGPAYLPLPGGRP